jgi:pyrimidine operon attenuation protein / uracil phosphoribosyltransferase
MRTQYDASDVKRVFEKLADKIAAGFERNSPLSIIGIRTRGEILAQRIAEALQRKGFTQLDRGTLDITLYRDDLSTIAHQPQIKESHLPVSIDDRLVVLCDDVLYTGRTVRAALDHLVDYGRPRAVRLAVLIDRGHRELPIQADVVGKTVPTSRDEVVEVSFQTTDGADQVRIMERSTR